MIQARLCSAWNAQGSLIGAQFAAQEVPTIQQRFWFDIGKAYA